MNHNQQIKEIDDRIQALYREKDRLEQERDAVDAPALIAVLLSSEIRFILHHTHVGRADLSTQSRDLVEQAILAYIGYSMSHHSSKPIATNLHVHHDDGDFSINHEWTGGSGDHEPRVAGLLVALKAIGIPRDRISLADYEHEVANHERNRKRVQADLDKVRALVEAY